MTNQPKQKTALMEVIDYCIRQIALYKDDDENICRAFLYAKTKAESLLPKERQNIVDAWCDDTRGKLKKELGEQYFNETYESHESQGAN